MFCSMHALQAIGFMVMPLCSSLLALTAAFGFVALSWNIINTAGNTYVLWIAAEAAAAKAARSGSNGSGGTASSSVLINTVNAAFGAGSLAAPVVAELCASALSKPLAAYYFTAALTALSAVTFLLLPSPKQPGSTNSNSSSTDAGAAVSSSAAAAAAAGSSDEQFLQQPLLAAAAADSDAAVDIAGQAEAATAAVPQRNWFSGTLLLLLGVTAVFNLLNVGTEGACNTAQRNCAVVSLQPDCLS
jgi:hypothetical protein